MPHANFILSTCGTALLTNHAPEERQRINQYSNIKDAIDIPEEDRIWLKDLCELLGNELRLADLWTVARMSAELNGLIKFYGGKIERNHDHHILLCTDTWLGDQVAQIECEWLKQFCSSVEVIRPPDLQTADLESFQLALSELVRWSAEMLPGYSESGYHVVFNLTGGFKSVQGFLHTLAMFYADEVIYVFQEADTLMRIPRLPVKLTADDTVRKHLSVFRRLGMGLEIQDSGGVPETMFMSIDAQVALSPWGSLVWEQTRKQIYRERLWPSLSAKIRYGDRFEDSLKDLSPDRISMVNGKIDALTHYFETGKDRRSLDFKELRGNPQAPSTHEIDAWSDQDAKRIYGHYENGSNVFVLDRLDKALH